MLWWWCSAWGRWEPGAAAHGPTSTPGEPLPALVFGGRALGLQGGQFQSVTAPHNALWMTIAQAFLATADPLSEFQDEVFLKTDASPIPGLWQPVA